MGENGGGGANSETGSTSFVRKGVSLFGLAATLLGLFITGSLQESTYGYKNLNIVITASVVLLLLFILDYVFRGGLKGKIKQVFESVRLYRRYDSESLRDWDPEVIEEYDPAIISAFDSDALEAHEETELAEYEPESIQEHSESPLDAFDSATLQRHEESPLDEFSSDGLDEHAETDLSAFDSEVLERWSQDDLEALELTGISSVHSCLDDAGYSPEGILSQAGEATDAARVDDHFQFKGVFGTNWFGEPGDRANLKEFLDEHANHASQGMKFLLLDPKGDTYDEIDSPITNVSEYYQNIKDLDDEYPNRLEIRLYDYHPVFRLNFIGSSRLILQHYTGTGSEEMDDPCLEIRRSPDYSVYRAFEYIFDKTFENTYTITDTTIPETSVEAIEQELTNGSSPGPETPGLPITERFVEDQTEETVLVSEDLPEILCEAATRHGPRMYESRPIEELDFDE